MRSKLTSTVIAKLEIPDGRASIKLLGTEVGGLGVRETARVPVLANVPIQQAEGLARQLCL